MFFILSTGRSGSTSIANILNKVEGCFGIHEPTPELTIEASGYRYGEISSATIRNLLKETRKPVVTNRIYCESNQNLSLIIPELVAVFPDARFIWFIRNGLDVVASAYQKQWYTGHSENHSRYEKCSIIEKAWIDGRIRGDRLGEISDAKWTAMDRFEKCCWYWGYVNRLIEEDLNNFATNKFFILRLEDMQQDFYKLLSWMGLSHFPDHLITRDNIAKRFPLHWTEWSLQQQQSFSHWCGDIMDHFYPSWRAIFGENGRVFVAPTIEGLRQMVNIQQQKIEAAHAEIDAIKSSYAWRIWSYWFSFYKKIKKQF